MPIFEFICTQCCNKFERLLRISDTKGLSCPECHSKKVTRLFSTFGVVSIGSQVSNFNASSNSSSSCCGGVCGCSH